MDLRALLPLELKTELLAWMPADTTHSLRFEKNLKIIKITLVQLNVTNKASTLSKTNRYWRKHTPSLLKRVRIVGWSSHSKLLSRLCQAENISIVDSQHVSNALKWKRRLVWLFKKCRNVRRLSLDFFLPNTTYMKKLILALPETLEELSVKYITFNDDPSGNTFVQSLAERIPRLRSLKIEAIYEPLPDLTPLAGLSRLELAIAPYYEVNTAPTLEMLQSLPKSQSIPVGPNVIVSNQTLFSHLLSQFPAFDIELAREFIAAGLDPNIDLGFGLRPIAKCATKESMQFMLNEIKADYISPMGSFSTAAAILYFAKLDAALEFFLHSTETNISLENIITELPEIAIVSSAFTPYRFVTGESNPISQAISVLTHPDVIKKHNLDLTGVRDMCGNSILHIAIALGCNEASLDALLALGLDINVQNEQGESAIDFAMRTRDPQTLIRKLAPLLRGPVPLSRLRSVCENRLWALLPPMIEHSDPDELRNELCRIVYPQPPTSCLSIILESFFEVNVQNVLEKVGWVPKNFPGSVTAVEKLSMFSPRSVAILLNSGLSFTLLDMYKLIEANIVSSLTPQLFALIDFRNLDLESSITSFSDQDYTPIMASLQEYGNIFLRLLRNLETSGYDTKIIKCVLGSSQPLNSCLCHILKRAEYYKLNSDSLKQWLTYAAAYITMYRKYFSIEDFELLMREIREAPDLNYSTMLEESLKLADTQHFSWLELVPEPAQTLLPALKPTVVAALNNDASE